MLRCTRHIDPVANAHCGCCKSVLSYTVLLSALADVRLMDGELFAMKAPPSSHDEYVKRVPSLSSVKSLETRENSHINLRENAPSFLIFYCV